MMLYRNSIVSTSFRSGNAESYGVSKMRSAEYVRCMRCCFLRPGVIPGGK